MPQLPFTPPLTFEDFAKLYRATFARMMEYSPDQVGSTIYVERLAILAEMYPDWAEQVENTQED